MLNRGHQHVSRAHLTLRGYKVDIDKDTNLLTMTQYQVPLHSRVATLAMFQHPPGKSLISVKIGLYLEQIEIWA